MKSIWSFYYTCLIPWRRKLEVKGATFTQPLSVCEQFCPRLRASLPQKHVGGHLSGTHHLRFHNRLLQYSAWESVTGSQGKTFSKLIAQFSEGNIFFLFFYLIYLSPMQEASWKSTVADGGKRFSSVTHPDCEGALAPLVFIHCKSRKTRNNWNQLFISLRPRSEK